MRVPYATVIEKAHIGDVDFRRYPTGSGWNACFFTIVDVHAYNGWIGMCELKCVFEIASNVATVQNYSDPSPTCAKLTTWMRTSSFSCSSVIRMFRKHMVWIVEEVMVCVNSKYVTTYTAHDTKINDELDKKNNSWSRKKSVAWQSVKNGGMMSEHGTPT